MQSGTRRGRLSAHPSDLLLANADAKQLHHRFRCTSGCSPAHLQQSTAQARSTAPRPHIARTRHHRRRTSYRSCRTDPTHSREHASMIATADAARQMETPLPDAETSYLQSYLQSYPQTSPSRNLQSLSQLMSLVHTSATSSVLRCTSSRTLVHPPQSLSTRSRSPRCKRGNARSCRDRSHRTSRRHTPL